MGSCSAHNNFVGFPVRPFYEDLDIVSSDPDVTVSPSSFGKVFEHDDPNVS